MARLIHPLMYMVKLRQLHESKVEQLFSPVCNQCPMRNVMANNVLGNKESLWFISTCTFALCWLLTLVHKITFRSGNHLRPLFLSFVFCTLLTDLNRTHWQMFHGLVWMSITLTVGIAASVWSCRWECHSVSSVQYVVAVIRTISPSNSWHICGSNSTNPSGHSSVCWSSLLLLHSNIQNCNATIQWKQCYLTQIVQ